MKRITHEQYADAYSICKKYLIQLRSDKHEVEKNHKELEKNEPLHPNSLLLDAQISIRLINIVKHYGLYDAMYEDKYPSWGIKKDIWGVTIEDISNIQITKIKRTRGVGKAILSELNEVVTRAGLIQKP